MEEFIVGKKSLCHSEGILGEIFRKNLTNEKARTFLKKCSLNLKKGAKAAHLRQGSSWDWGPAGANLPPMFSMVCSLQQLRWSKVDTLGWKRRRRQDPRAHQPLSGTSTFQDQHHPHAPHAMPPEKQPQSPQGQMPHGDPVTSTRRMSSAEMSSTFCSTCSTSLVSSSTSILPRYATPSPLGQNQGQASDPGVPSPWLRPVFASKGLCCRGRRSG